MFKQLAALPLALLSLAALAVSRDGNPVVQGGYRLVANFTPDRNAVAAAIERPASFRSPDPLQLAGVPPISKLEMDELLGERFGITVRKSGAAAALSASTPFMKK